MTKASSHAHHNSAPVLRVAHILKSLDTDPPHYFYRFSFTDLNGRRRTLDLPRETSIAKLVRALLAHGLNAPPHEVRALVDDALANEPDNIIGATLRSGWRGEAYIGHRASYGAGASKLLGSVREPALRCRRGSLDDWKAGLHAPCLKSDALTFSICLAFASLIPGLLGIERGVLFHLWGEPEAHISVCSRAAQSVFGRARKVDVSANTLRPGTVAERCASRSDLLAIFDEIRLDTEMRKALIDAVVHSVDAAPSKHANRSKRLELGWRTMGLSTSEAPFGRRVRGTELQHVDLPVLPMSAGGIFNALAEDDDAGDLAAQAEETVEANYGIAFDAFIRHLVDNQAEVKAAAIDLQMRFVEAVRKRWKVFDHPLASAFGLVFAASVIATRAGTTPWRGVTHVERVVVRLYRRALASSFDPVGKVDFLLALLALARAAGCLPHVEKSLAIPAGAVGIRRKLPTHGECVLLRRDYLHTFWPDARDLDLVIEELKARGLLVLAKRGRINTIQAQVEGVSSRSRYYGLKASGVFADVPRAA
ncbi:DUF927 domain-containing protein [Ancylobacter sp. Lp-2]|uniref:DUF927 domain-containing protein n=1 Tax=Ancylobacter sp. Lp-2 TaxID=2881339 RepID=UPI001E5895D9|nr:DUF927 domain-containing protein [Ancylobacter sp. Lp-2]MCB4767313.1 DUF927 domain-containing protein [Ancylobacter sp. Lp-2]